MVSSGIVLTTWAASMQISEKILSAREEDDM